MIISGSPKGDNIVDTHQRFYKWVLKSNLPIFGICAGHQILGKLFGGKIISDLEQENGELPVDIERSDEIFN